MPRLSKRQGYIFLLLIAGLVLRLIFSSFGTLQLDMGTFVSWANSLYTGGLKNFYNGWSDYLPGYLYVLWLLGKANSMALIPESVLFKLPAILADLITGVFIYKIIKKSADPKDSKREKLAIIAAALYVFNPAIIYNSALWGQVDSFTALTSIMAVYFLPINIIISAVSLAVGTLIKPQTAFIFPVIIFFYIRNKKKFLNFLIYCAVGLTVFVAAFVPFWNHGTLITFIIERLNLSLNQYPYTSVNAFNFWGLTGSWKPDSLVYQFAGYLIVLIASIFLSFKLWKARNAEYLLMAFIYGASFMFFTRMHERHMLPVFAPLVIAAMENPFLLIPYLGLSATYVANLTYAYYWITDDFKSIFSESAITLIEIFNIGMLGIIFYGLAAKVKKEWKNINFNLEKIVKIKNLKPVEYKLPKIGIPESKTKIILVAILTFAFISRVFALNSPTTMYFDEVYHAFTAKVLMSPEVTKAWEWWNDPPEGFAYEWTHPPIAKLGMVAGMSLFGQNAFGWRIPGAMLGLGIVYLVYLLGKTIFKDEWVGLISAAVYSLDGLALVMSRIGMNDSYILFFVLLSLYLYIKNKNLASALVFGFALASKWSSIWAIPIFAILFITQKKKLDLSYAWFFILPPLIYLASYFDMFLTGHSFKTWWEMQQQMWWYHTGLRATHSYSSPWWSWPFLIRPIYLYTSDEIGGMVARIYAFGNPLVFWFGLASVFSILITAVRERNKKLGLIVFSYLIFFVPWALSPRIMFIYHYLPSIPFMCIAAGYVLRRNLKLAPYFFIPALIVFIYFYPHYTGMQVPLWLDTSYYWFSSWR